MLLEFHSELKKMNEMMDRLDNLETDLPAYYTVFLKQTFDRLNGKESSSFIPESDVLLEDLKQQLNEVIA